MQALREGMQVAVRVGHDTMYAILIKDANGKVRSSFSNDSVSNKSALPQELQINDFLKAGHDSLVDEVYQNADESFCKPTYIRSLY